MLALAIQCLLLIYIIFCFNKNNCQVVLKNFSWIWVSLALWLVVTLVQAMALFGYHNYDKYTAFLELNLYFAYGCFLFLMLCLLSNVTRVRIVIYVLVLVAMAQTAFGMMNYYDIQTPFEWMPTYYARSRVTGTFVNRNMYTNYIVMIVGFIIVPVILKNTRVKAAKVFSWNGMKKLFFASLCLTLFVLLMFGVVLSGSKGGPLAFIIGLIGVSALSYHSKYSRFNVVGFVGAAMAFVVGVQYFGADLLISRLQRIFSDSSDRFEQWNATITLISDKLFLGYGPGSYEIAYKTGIPITASPLVHDHAHNDYLELIFEQGLIGGLSLFIGISLAIYYGYRKLVRSRSGSRAILILSAMLGIISMIVHASYDFPFQVPSNVILFLGLVSIMLASTHIEFRPQIRQSGT